MAAKAETAFASHAVTDPDGIVAHASPWGIAHPGDAQANADYIAGWGAEAGQTVHVWMGGGVEGLIGRTLDGLPAAHATAVKS